MREAFWLQTVDKDRLFVAMLRLLVGNAHVSFEGEPGQLTSLFRIPGSSATETTVLRRNTVSPTLDFVIIPLEVGTLESLVRESTLPLRLARDVVHAQIEKAGSLEFRAGDYFHDECVAVGPAVPPAILESLRESGVLRGFRSGRQGFGS